MCIRDRHHSAGLRTNLRIHHHHHHLQYTMTDGGGSPTTSHRILRMYHHHHRQCHHSGSTHTYTHNSNVNNTQMANEQLYFVQRTHKEQNMRSVSYTHLDVYKRQTIPGLYIMVKTLVDW